MREFSTVRPDFWIGETGRRLREHPPHVRELAFYLMTAPGHEAFGLYYKPIQAIASDMGRDEAVIVESFQVLAELGYCQYDAVSGWVWVLNMCKFQYMKPLKGIDFRSAHANRWYSGLPKNPFLGPFFDAYCEFLALKGPRRSFGDDAITLTRRNERTQASPSKGAVSRSVSVLSPDPSLSVSQTQALVVVEPAPAELLLIPDANRPTAQERRAVFERFWKAYPKKTGKKAAWLAWEALQPNRETAEKIMASVEVHKRSVRWARDGGQYIPDPERYLKHERWNDDLSELPMLTKQTIQNTHKFGSFLDGFR